MALLDDGAWQGKLWTGAWTDGSGGTYDVVEPATGHIVAIAPRPPDPDPPDPGAGAPTVEVLEGLTRASPA